mgnify:CR=1 FL=1
MSQRDDILKVLLSEEQLKEKCAEMGAQITRDYAGKNLLLVTVLKGAVVYMADLMRCIDLPCAIDFLSVSSYGAGTTTSGEVRILKDLDSTLEGRDVLVVEDILDSGKTLHYISEMLRARRPASIKICTFLDKPERRMIKDLKADYAGTEVPDEFVVGYGLDYAEKYRNVPFLGVLSRSVYEK